MSLKITQVFLLATVILLTSCGGGTKSTPTLNGYTTTEFSCPLQHQSCTEVYTAYEEYRDDGMPQNLAVERALSVHLRPINADAAYARGFTGRGVVIGQVERDIDASHPELRGVLVEDPYRQYAAEDWAGVLFTPAEAKDHALATAALAAGRRNGVSEQQQGMHGVAYEAKVRFVSDLNSHFRSYRLPDGVPQIFSKDATMLYLNDRVEIGFSAIGSISDLIGREYTKEFVASARGGAIFALRQADTPAAQRTIWVFAAGNEELQHPSGNAALPYFIPELKSHVIAAVGLGEDGAILSYSNRCGAAQDFCIAAPGQTYTAAGRELYEETHGAVTDAEWQQNPAYQEFEGTSAAAPTVAGSLAILKQAFPELGNPELVTRLFRTANKRGIYADRSIYGQGLVDLDAATRPAGEMRLATTNRLSGTAATPQSSHLGFTGAAGTPAELAQTQIMLLDDLDAPWYVTGDRFVRNPALDLTATRIEALQQRLQYPETESQPWLDMAGKYHARGQLQYRPQQTMQWAMRSAPNQDSVAFRLTPAVRAGQSLSFSLGALHEGKAFLGSKASGAFGQLSATSVMSEISKTWQLGSWTSKARASLGLTAANVSDGLLRESDPVVASAFALETTRQFRHSNLRFSVSQPLRIESGSLRLAYPATRTRDRTLIVKETELSLEPDARQLDYEVSWMYAASSHSKVGLSAWATTNAGHARSASVKTGVAAVYQKRF